MSESNTTISDSSVRTPSTSSFPRNPNPARSTSKLSISESALSSCQSVSEAPVEAPFRCFHLRLLHSKCGHVSFLECHEQLCKFQQVGWIAEQTLPDPPSSCFEMKHYICIKDERCKRTVNPIVLPLKMIDGIVEGWKIQMDHMKAQKLQLDAQLQERMQVCVASAEVEEQGDSSRNSEETVIYFESNERPKSSESEWLMTFE